MVYSFWAFRHHVSRVGGEVCFWLSTVNTLATLIRCRKRQCLYLYLDSGRWKWLGCNRYGARLLPSSTFISLLILVCILSQIALRIQHSQKIWRIVPSSFWHHQAMGTCGGLKEPCTNLNPDCILLDIY